MTTPRTNHAQAQRTPIFDPRAQLPTGLRLLEASAGTGKTHTITSLVLRLIAERHTTLPRLLVVTFTRAAAAELRERIRTRLSSAALAVEQAAEGSERGSNDDVVTELVAGATGDHVELTRRGRALREASEQLDDATITTIHGFCQRMLTLTALETGVDFDAELIEDERTLIGEVADDLADRRLRHVDAEWYAYLREVMGVNHEQLETIAAQAVAGARPRVLPEHADDLDPIEPWHTACERLRTEWARYGDDLPGALRPLVGPEGLTDWRRSNGVDPTETTRQRFDDWLASGPPLPSSKEWETDSGVGWLLSRFRKGPERGVHPLLDAAIDVRAAACAPANLLLAQFALEAVDELDARKRRARVIAFDDQLRRLVDALDDPSRHDQVVAAIRERYDAALIDEFQDTDPLQWRIFSAAFAATRLTLIGDPKQAIYSFRGADLPTYLEAKQAVDPAARSSLTVNWRSDQRYLDAVNAVFATPNAFGDHDIDAPAVTAVDHHRADRLRWPDGAPRPALRLRYVPHAAAEPDGGVNGASITKWWAHRHLPVDVAAQVHALLDDPPQLATSDGERPLEPGDVAVLVRTNRQAQSVYRELMTARIPATLTRAGSVFASTEADEVIRLLEALAEPAREPLARAAAATRLFRWTAADLVDPDNEPAWEAWTAQLREWERQWHDRGVMAALRAVFADEDVWPRLLAAEGGERVTANLSHIAERLHAAEQAERLGPAALLSWLRAMREEAREQDAAAAGEDAELRLERDDAAVQVVTVHASKGLEYPVVLCPFLWDGALLRQNEAKVLRFHDPDRGHELTLDLDRNSKDEPKAGHVAVAKAQRHAESLRLAYVALTRAEHLAVVWWGRFSDAATSPLAGLLHRQPPDHPYQAGERALGRDDDALLADLHALAHAHDAIGVETLDARPAAPPPLTSRAAPAHGELAVATFDRSLDRAWQRSSFTGLTRAAHTADAGAGEMGREDDEPDAADVGDPGAEPTDRSEAVPLADLPRGPAFGDAVHGILEDTDFTADPDAPGGLAAAVDRHVARSPVLTPAHRDALRDGLAGVLATPLGADLDDARLDAVARGDRLDELAFELPLAGGTTPDGSVTVRRLRDCLAAHPDGHEAAAALAALGRDTVPVRGFLTGSVDLVARLLVGGRPRYVVMDYKTTWLGERADRRTAPDQPDHSTLWHYRPDALEAAMRPHAYHLQALLYLVAVHRYLRSRLGAAYDANRDLAGAAYLFVRGMSGPAARRDDGRTHGVWRWRPSAELIDDTSELLATGERRRT